MNREKLINRTSSYHHQLHRGLGTKISVAPGRVNLMGEHTDYNDGFVLPTAIDFFTCVCGSLKEGSNVSITALDFDNEVDHFDLQDDILPHDDDIWKNYIRGAFYFLKMEGYSLGGCALTISGTIPKGTGLSSSASLEIAVLNTLSELFGLSLDNLKMAQIGQKIENEFVGLSCGIMDQLSSACGIEGQALQIDCRNFKITNITIPTSLSLMIVNSNIKRQLTTSAYNDRRRECQQAAEFMGAKSLRDITEKTFLSQKNCMPELLARRAEHIITENARVIKMATALRKTNIEEISSIMADSHTSMKNLFEISTPEIDILVNIISKFINVSGGVRMTGGGFGGCVVALLPTSSVEGVRQQIESQYPYQTGLEACIYLNQPARGVETVQGIFS